MPRAARYGARMDVDVIASELVRAVRGHRSQIAFSRRIGYASNVVANWESGRRFPTAAEFFRAAERTGLDVRVALGRFYRTPPEWLTRADPGAESFPGTFLRDQRGGTSVNLVASRAGVSRHAASRWLTGENQPRLPDFLAMVEATSLRLVDFVAAFVDPDEVPSVADAWRVECVQRDLALEEPWSQGVLRALELLQLDGLRGEAAIVAAVAAHLSLPVPAVERVLESLLACGLVVWDGARYQVSAARVLDTRRSPESARRIKAFWGAVALERLEAGQPMAAAYNLFAVSESQLRRLNALHDAYFQAVRALVAEDEPPECVALVSLQLLRLGQAPPK